MPIKINGSTSGYTEIKAPDTAPNNTLTLPSTSGTLMTTGGSNTFTANQVIEVTDNSNAALRITQLGTADAIRVEDSTNPDSTPFIVDASGNVGIGAVSPNAKLETNNATAGAEVSRFEGNYSGSGSVVLTNWRRSGGSVAAIMRYNDAATTMDFGTTTSHAQTFITGGTERMRISSDGLVYINTTTQGASARVTINGTGNVIAAWNPATTGNPGFISFGTEGTYTERGFIYYDRTAGQTKLSATSDARLKENITDAPSAIDKIKNIKVRQYDWKETGTTNIGFIAQELEPVVPRAVLVGEDNEDGTIKRAWGVDNGSLVPYLTKALQEALSKIDALEARIATLENA